MASWHTLCWADVYKPLLTPSYLLHLLPDALLVLSAASRSLAWYQPLRPQALHRVFRPSGPLLHCPVIVVPQSTH